MQPARIAWPRKAHPQALTEAGRSRTPWLTSWARATFEQGVLSLLPLEGPCCAASLPGEHLFQASAMPTKNPMRPAIVMPSAKRKQVHRTCCDAWRNRAVLERRTFRLHGPMMTGNHPWLRWRAMRNHPQNCSQVCVRVAALAAVLCQEVLMTLTLSTHRRQMTLNLGLEHSCGRLHKCKEMRLSRPQKWELTLRWLSTRSFVHKENRRFCSSRGLKLQEREAYQSFTKTATLVMKTLTRCLLRKAVSFRGKRSFFSKPMRLCSNNGKNSNAA